MSEPRVLVLGCGYVGMRLAAALAAQGAQVLGTTRRRERFAEIAAAGARPFLADALSPAGLRPLRDWQPDAVFDLVRPQQTAPERYTSWGTRNLADAFRGLPLQALVYLSSTAVYGPRGGEWTDEQTEPRPSSARGIARLEAEDIYRAACRDHALPVRICRVPGIYGPGRTLRQRLETGAYRRLDDDRLYVSRIHVDDLVRGLLAAWRAGRPGETYLLCDDEPVTAQEYAELTARVLGLPLPPAVSREHVRGELSQSAFDRRIADRRCSNRRMREELGVLPRYPSVRQGVPAALLEEGAIQIQIRE